MTDETGDDQQPDAQVVPPTERRARLAAHWEDRLGPGQRSAVLAWAAFAATFAGARAVTHWIRDGHGPASGGMSVGGRHFHHYNIGILLLTGVGAVAVRGHERHRRHPGTALAFGAATALIADEAALLIDLQDVYWAKQGRTSVDIAVGAIALGGLGIAGSSFWPSALRALRGIDDPVRRSDNDCGSDTASRSNTDSRSEPSSR